MNELEIADTIKIIREQSRNIGNLIGQVLDRIEEQIKLMDKEKAGVREQKIINEQTKRILEEKTAKVQQMLDNIGMW